MNRYRLTIFLCLVLLLPFQQLRSKVVVLYDNDVHCHIAGYESMAALRDACVQDSAQVCVVSCGDFVQGNKVGCISQGAYPVQIMNAVHYDYYTLGNHEFDYGISRLKKLVRRLDAQCLCCNLTYLPSGKQLFDACHIRDFGTMRVAFIGVATPTTITNSLPTTFQNRKKEWLYDFHNKDVYQLVQQAADSARAKGADYVIVLSHLGDDTRRVNSVELAEQTEEIDVILDGHAHHVLDRRIVNAEGKQVMLCSTGTEFKNIGCLEIDDEKGVTNSLVKVSAYPVPCAAVRGKINQVMSKVEKQTSRYIGYAEVQLADKDSAGRRLVRKQETNLGDFVSDAMRIVSGADIGVVNGGGLRSSLSQGKVTNGDLLQIFPFNNTLCVIEATGQQLLDALEISVSMLNQESGDFLHVSGLRFVVDCSIPSPVHINEDNQCDSIGEVRRVLKAEVLRGESWQAVHSDSVYTVGGQNYVALCGGSAGMFRGAKVRAISRMSDEKVLEKYIQQLDGTIRSSQYAVPQGRIELINKR